MRTRDAVIPLTTTQVAKLYAVVYTSKRLSKRPSAELQQAFAAGYLLAMRQRLASANAK